MMSDMSEKWTEDDAEVLAAAKATTKALMKMQTQRPGFQGR
jgi:hypothetical protein